MVAARQGRFASEVALNADEEHAIASLSIVDGRTLGGCMATDSRRGSWAPGDGAARRALSPWPNPGGRRRPCRARCRIPQSEGGPLRLRVQLVVRGSRLPRRLGRCPIRSGRKRRRGCGDDGWCRFGHRRLVVGISACWLVVLKVVCSIVVTWDGEWAR